MNAEEAFQTSNQSLETVHKDLIEAVLNAITDACKRAEFSISWPLAHVEKGRIRPLAIYLESKKFRVHREHQIESERWVERPCGPYGLFTRKIPSYTYSFYLRISWYKPDSSV